MKLKNIAQKNGKAINLELVKDGKRLIIANQEFEINDERAKELLKKTVDGKPIVEKLKEDKAKGE